MVESKRKASRAHKLTPRLRKKFDASLVQVEQAELVRRLNETDLAYLFKHNLIQETAYSSLLLHDRRKLHRAVARALEDAYPERLDELASLLAQHYTIAEDKAKALEYETRAGDVAVRVYATAEAVGHYRRGLALAFAQSDSFGRPAAGLAHIYPALGRALELDSRFEEASQVYDEMEVTAQRRGDSALELAALTQRAFIRAIPTVLQDPPHARRLAEQALARARALGDRAAEAKILWILLLLDIYSNADPNEAIEYGEQSLAIARELNLRDQMAYTLHDIFVAYTYIGDFDRAFAARKEAAAMWRELDNLPLLAENLVGTALLYWERAQIPEAMTDAEEGARISLAIGNLNGQSFAGLVLSQFHLELGENVQALQWLEVPRQLTGQGTLEGGGMSPSGELAWIYANMGETERARELAQVSLERSRHQSAVQREWVGALVTRIELRAGQLATAEDVFRQANLAPSLQSYWRLFPLGVPVMYFAPAELALAKGDYGRVIEVIDEFLEELSARHIQSFAEEALFLKAQAQLGQGERALARQTLSAAREAAEKMLARRVLWEMLALSSELALTDGDATEAESLREQAREIVGYIAEHAPPDLRESFLQLPKVRRLFETKTEANVGAG